MSLMDDLLARLRQHVAAQASYLPSPDQYNQDPVGSAGRAALAPIRSALDTVGLAQEGTGNVAKATFGELSYLAALAQVKGAQAGLPGFDPNSAATQVSQQAVDAGWQHPRQVQDILRNGPDSLMAWLAGAGEMAADPTNLIAGPTGEAANAAKAAKLEEIAGRTADLSDTFYNDLANELLVKLKSSRIDQKAADKAGAGALARLNASLADGGLGRDLVDNAANVTDPSLFTLPPTSLDQVSNKVRALVQRDRALKGLATAEDKAGSAASIYKDVQNQKEAAVRDLFPDQKVNGRLPRGFRQTPEYGQAVDDAKTLVERLNPQGPQNRENWQQFTGGRKERLAQMQQRADQAMTEFKAAFAGTADQFPATDTPAVQQAIAGGMAPEVARQRSASLGQLNGQENEFFNAVTPAAEGLPTAAADEGLPVAKPLNIPPKLETVAPSPLPVAAKTADNPEYLASVRDQATQVANLAPGPSAYPELDDPKAGRMVDLINHAFKEGLVEMKAAYSRPWKKMGPKDIASVWYGVNIQTVKNLLQDPVFARFVLKNEGIAQKAMTDNERIIINRLTTGEKDPLSLFGTLGDVLVQLGLTGEKHDPKYTAEVMKKLGGNPFDNEAEIAQHLNGMQQALVGTGLQLANPVRGVTGLLTAPGNLLIPLRARMFHIINNVTHVSSRVAAFEQAAFPMLENSARALLARAAAEGKDVTPLLGRGLERGGDVLAQEGLFSWHEAANILGPRYGKEWKAISEAAMDAGYENSRRVLGNYQLDGVLGAAEQQIRKVVPLQSWSWRAYKRTAKYALQHPAISLGLLHIFGAMRQHAADTGMPGYMVGTIGGSINPDTPFIGMLADVFTPEQEAEFRVNPLSMFSPLGGDLLGAGLDNGPEADTAYQKAAKALAVTGASFSPVVQEGAYLTGQDYKAPAPGSRYSNIDLLAGDLGGPTAPTIAGPNKKLRAAVAPIFGADGSDNFDPVVNKANELAYERTGKVISDPSNRALALDLKNHGPFYQEAQLLLDQGGAARSAVNAVSPTSLVTRTQTTADRQAAGDPPYSYDVLQAAKAAGLADTVKMMNAANDQWYRDHPAAAVNKKADLPKEASQDPRLAAFEQKNLVLKRYAPKAYAQALAEYKKTLGIR